MPMAAGSGGKTYGEWSQVTVIKDGMKITLETDISEEEMRKKLFREGYRPIEATKPNPVSSFHNTKKKAH